MARSKEGVENEEIDWDGAYRRGQTPWDYGAAAPELRRLIGLGLIDGPVLVPGCGRGHDVAALAGAGLNVVGYDLSETALAEAAARYPELEATWEFGDLFAPKDTLRGAFATVWEHTCLTALPLERHGDYFRAVAEFLRPGGRLVGQFFTDARLDPGESGPPFANPRGELIRLASEYFRVIWEWAPVETYESRDAEELMLVMEKLG